MANKEVHVGDDWYLDENNDGDLIVVNSNTGKVVKAIDKETGDEDKKGNSVNKLLRAQLEEISTPSTPPSGYKELFTKSSGLTHVLDDAGNETPLLGQAGSSTWKNRTYESYEVVDTATTYTIGSTGDYSDIYSAAADLQGLILKENITLSFQENITEPDIITFQGLVSSKGELIIELNGNTWTLDQVNSKPFVKVDLSGSGGEMIANSSVGQVVDLGFSRIAKTSLDFTVSSGVTLNSFFRVKGPTSDMFFNNDIGIFTNNGTINKAWARACFGGTATCRQDPPSFYVDFAGMIIKHSGNILTEGGTITAT